MEVAEEHRGVDEGLGREGIFSGAVGRFARGLDGDVGLDMERVFGGEGVALAALHHCVGEGYPGTFVIYD